MTEVERRVGEFWIDDPDCPGRTIAGGFFSPELAAVRFWCDRILLPEQAVQVGEALIASARTVMGGEPQQ